MSTLGWQQMRGGARTVRSGGRKPMVLLALANHGKRATHIRYKTVQQQMEPILTDVKSNDTHIKQKGVVQEAAAPAKPSPPAAQQPTENIVTEGMLRDVQKLLSSIYYEYEYWVQDAWVEGEIPKTLEGTYFRNGPGLQVTNKAYSRHPFDGDGMVCSFAFKDGKVFFQNKFVRTKGFLDEQAAGRPVHRSAFTRGAADGSSVFNPFDMDMKNVANTGVLHWGGRLLALWENGLPYELDPHALETLGETRLGGQIPTKALGAHYRIMEQPDGSKRWVTFALNPGAACSVSLFEFDEAGVLLQQVDYTLPETMATIIHDIAVTEHYYVVVEGPVQFDVGRFLSGYLWSKCSMAECLVFNPEEGTRVHLIPREKGAQGGARIFSAPPFFSFHHANAYELEEQQVLVLDTLAWSSVDFGNFNYDVEDLNTEYYRLRRCLRTHFSLL